MSSFVVMIDSPDDRLHLPRKPTRKNMIAISLGPHFFMMTNDSGFVFFRVLVSEYFKHYNV